MHAGKCLALVGLVLSAAAAQAEVKPMSLFSDNMVLQRDVPLPVWGTAAPSENVTVEFAYQSKSVTADANGVWLVGLDPMPVSAEPRKMTIIGTSAAGSAILEIRNVVVGEVWLAGGQSNMEMKLSAAEGGEEAVKQPDDRLFRYFSAGASLPLEPRRDVRGNWSACMHRQSANWSAAAYFFARQLRQTLGVPVGIIHTARGWTPAEAWTSRAALLADPELKSIVASWDLWTAAYPGAKQLYEKKLAEWDVAVRQAKAEGRHAPAKPAPPNNPEFLHRASSLYNGTIAPLVPYAMRGVIWYQGETNASRADQYRRLFPLMIRDWRTRWGLGDFPFLYVQIAPLEAGPGAVNRAELRDAQREGLAVPNTAMVVTLDIGDPKNEHPKNKQEVGRRLALAAQKLAYAEDVSFSGPLYRDMQIEGGSIRLRFDHVDGGLVAKDGRLRDFVVAGADRKFVPAEARIAGAELIVSASGVPQPQTVRYAWVNYTTASLFNQAGLPASPFRTDNWPLTTRGETKMFFDQIGLDEKTLTPKAGK